MEPPFSILPSTILLVYSNVPELVLRHMKKQCFNRECLKLRPVRTTQVNANVATLHCQVQPSPWVCCSQYLQEWNKVVLFQVITARLGQEVHKFRSVVVTGLQSSGEEKREQMVARLLPLSL